MIPFVAPTLEGKWEDWTQPVQKNMLGDNKTATDVNRENAAAHK